MGPCLGRDPVGIAKRMTKTTVRRVWLVGLCLYAIGGAADAAIFLRDEVRAGQDWRSLDNLAVAFSAGLFWPVDLVARLLLNR
jgi:hypothetical protein